MKNLIFSAVFGLIASTASAETIFLYEDTDDLPPPYFQSWRATPEDKAFDEQTDREVFIRGEGKLGEFFGVLYVDCEQPEYSRWLVSDGFLDPEDVPVQAIRNLRAAICDSGEDA
ncbi:hypothetical protein GS634_22090 [Ruegeria atlantica]|uniref:Rap1a immunity protein domain-containing protein n=1 Tax=Ruegeria atlantica TaxID=81569 RepID=A0AA91BQ98_9RHOB|nr:hypothetical protein [Ruegeria atlantica]NOE20830.1 hypothetical protein [Ruegeria atlantica]